MARSTYVYIVSYGGPWATHKPVIPFTVKHEALTWLSKQEDKDLLKVWRYKDGQLYEPVELNVEEA